MSDDVAWLIGLGLFLNACAACFAAGFFRWLFLRMGGAPTGISIPFRESDGQWQEARAQIDQACATYREMRARFGDELWLVSHGEQEIEFTDWPMAAIGRAM